MLDPTRLWRQRQSTSARETARYAREAGRGGLFTFLMLGFIISAYAYGKMLLRLPPTYPFWWVGIAVLLPAVGFGSLRTYLREPDIVFLLAAEPRMRPYWRQSFLYSWALQSFAAIALMLALWPLYQHCRPDGAAEPLWRIWAELLVLKAAALAAGWQEGRIIGKGPRAALGGFRWIMTGLALYAMLALSTSKAAQLILAAALIYALGVRLMPKHAVDWQTLIRAERRTTAARRRVFGWFADVPELQGEVKRRLLWVWLVRGIPVRQSETMNVLLTLTFLRSELFGIVLRLTLTALFLESVLPGRWTVPIVSVLFVAMTALQLAGLSRAQTHAVWPRLYPIDAERQRSRSQRRITASTLFAQSTVLAAWGAFRSGSLSLTAILWLALLAGSWLAAIAPKKKPKP